MEELAGERTGGGDAVSGLSEKVEKLEEAVEKLASTTIPEATKNMKAEVRKIFGPTARAAAATMQRPTNLATLQATVEKL